MQGGVVVTASVHLLATETCIIILSYSAVYTTAVWSIVGLLTHLHYIIQFNLFHHFPLAFVFKLPSEWTGTMVNILANLAQLQTSFQTKLREAPALPRQLAHYCSIAQGVHCAMC